MLFCLTQYPTIPPLNPFSTRPLLLLLLTVALAAPCGCIAASADTAHDFAKWEKEIAAFEQGDATTPPPKDGILFIGSSTIGRWVTLTRDFPGLPVINRGFGGSEIVDATHYADRVIFPYQPRMIFLRSGCNDLHDGKSPGQVFEDFKEFVAKVHAKLPDTEIVYISLSPSIERWKEAEETRTLNSMVREYIGRNPRLKYIESYDISLGPDGKARPELFADDKLHFNAEGYKLLADRVRPYLPQKPQ